MDYEKEINELKRQLERLQNAFLQMSKNQVPVTEKADNASNKIPQVDENTSGVGENSAGLLDVAELSDENSTAIEDLAELIDDLEQRVEALEQEEI